MKSLVHYAAAGLVFFAVAAMVQTTGCYTMLRHPETGEAAAAVTAMSAQDRSCVSCHDGQFLSENFEIPGELPLPATERRSRGLPAESADRPDYINDPWVVISHTPWWVAKDLWKTSLAESTGAARSAPERPFGNARPSSGGAVMPPAMQSAPADGSHPARTSTEGTKEGATATQARPDTVGQREGSSERGSTPAGTDEKRPFGNTREPKKP